MNIAVWATIAVLILVVVILSLILRNRNLRLRSVEGALQNLKNNVAQTASAIAVDKKIREKAEKLDEKIKEAKTDEEAQTILTDIADTLDGLL